MPIGHYIPYLSTLVSFAFAAAVLYRWYTRRHTYLLLWGIGLALYGLGTLTEVILGLQWSPTALRLWYLCGAMLTASWLGQGTIFLLIRRKQISFGSLTVLGLLTILALVAVFTTTITAPASTVVDPAVSCKPVDIPAGVFNLACPVSSQYAKLMDRPGLLLALTIVLNIYGTIALVGGAVYSGYLFWRKRVLGNRVLGNVLIAAGGLSPALGGSFVKAGLGDWLYLSELIGAILMFAGFLVAVSPAPAGKTADEGVKPQTSRA